MAIWGNLGGTFNLGYSDGGTRGDAPGGTNRGGAQRPAIKTLSKNPFKLRLVRELIYQFINLLVYYLALGADIPGQERALTNQSLSPHRAGGSLVGTLTNGRN